MIDIEETALGTHERRSMTVSDGVTADQVPIQVIVGRQHRPCLALVAGIHGDEYDGILALHEVARELAATDLTGSLIIIPVANPFAFAAAQRRTPQDNKDLNRVFPGRADGSLSERLAHQLCTDILQQATLVLTLHGGGSKSALAPWIEFLDIPTPLGRATYDAARASGFPALVALPRLPGVLISAMEAFGVPVIEGEVGGRGTTRPADVAYYKERVYAVVRHAGLLPGADAPPVQSPALWNLCAVAAEVAGILLRQVELQQTVKQGDRLGAIVDIQGETVAVLTAPADGMVGGYHDHVGVQSGENVVTLWTPAQAQVYESKETVA